MNFKFIKGLVILGWLIGPFTYGKSSKCFSINDSGFCKDFMKDGIKIYAGPNMFKNSLGKTLSDVKDFDEQLSNLRNNPVYPAERTYLEKEYGCTSYDPFDFKDTNRYIYTYQCSSMVYDKVSKCNIKENSSKKIKKICKSTCLLYYEAIQSIFNNTKSCPDNSKQSVREAKLKEISTHCQEYTNDDEGCLLGVDEEADYCGFRNKDSRDKYCEENPNQICCTKTRKNDENNDKLLKICLYVIGGVVVLLIFVLIILKIYSANKNKRDKATKAKADALEKKREEEREKYREQLSREYTDTSFETASNAPLLQHINVDPNSNSPYNSPISPQQVQNNMNIPYLNGPNTQQPYISTRSLPQGTNYGSPHPLPLGSRDSPRNVLTKPSQHQGTPGINPVQLPPPRDREFPKNGASPPPHNQGFRGSPGSYPSNPPPTGTRDSQRDSKKDSQSNRPSQQQHQGTRGSPDYNPTNPSQPPSSQHQGSKGSLSFPKDSPKSGHIHPSQNQGSKDSPRNGPSQPPHHQDSRGSPGSKPSCPPPPQHQDSPRNSPRNGPSQPPHHQGSRGPQVARESPRISPKQHQGSRDLPRDGLNHPPQHQGSRDSPKNGPNHPPQHQGSRDSPKNGPNHPPQHQGSRDSPKNGPNHPPQHQGSRDSPKNGPNHPPQHQGSRDSPKNDPNHPPQHQG
ncbi:hypothetical protein LY90DRAFT_390885, partial [Neocallimastix californiae]